MDNTASDRQWVTCPGCAEAFDPEAEAQFRGADGTVQCPFCSTRFKLAGGAATPAAPATAEAPVAPAARQPAPGAPEPFIIEDDTPDVAADNEHDEPEPEESELNTLKVRALSAMRRAAYRSRSYSMIAAFFLVIAAVKLALLAYGRLRLEGAHAKGIAYALLAVVAAVVAGHFIRQVIELTRELNRPVLEDPDTPPDFSPLSDGSQQWKRLEDL